MPSVESSREVPERVLLVMSFSEEAEQLAATLRELGVSACELVQDAESARRRCIALRPELLIMDVPARGAEATTQLAASLRSTTDATFVYACEPDTVPPDRLASLCATQLEKPVTRARLQRCLQGLARNGETERSALERALSFHDELLASMAHELRAPLQGVSGFAQHLLAGKAGALSETQRSCLEQIELGAEHVLQVIHDVLDLTDRTVDTLQVRTEVVDTEKVVREVLQVLQAFAIRRRIGVEVAVDGRMGHVVCDATKLKQVLYNLVSNALKYTPPSGRVNIALLRLDADSFCMQVSDTGPGLPDAWLAHLNATTAAPMPPGQARGLSLTRRIVAALGGTLRAQNRPQSGAELRVELPLAPTAINPYSRL